jgi:hypothetical protein
MPFTPAHAAAALPFFRTRLIFSALVMGTFAPDFEYFLRLTPRGKFGHTLPGIFLFSWPAALVALWIFHRWVKWPVVMMLPGTLRERLTPHLKPFAFGPWKRFGAIAGAAFLGIVTHIAWDSFTHPGSPLVRHVAALNVSYTLPLVGPYALCRILQHVSSLVGLLLVLVWILRWYGAAPRLAVESTPGESRWRRRVWVVILLVAVAGGLVRGWMGVPPAYLSEHASRPLGNFVVASIALIWWQLAVMGYFADSSGELKRLLRGVNAALTATPDTHE